MSGFKVSAWRNHMAKMNAARKERARLKRELKQCHADYESILHRFYLRRAQRPGPWSLFLVVALLVGCVTKQPEKQGIDLNPSSHTYDNAERMVKSGQVEWRLTTNVEMRLMPVAKPSSAKSIMAPLPVSSRALTLAWDANTEPDVIGYTVYWGSEPRVYGYSFDTTNLTATVASNLVSGTNYFAVTARSAMSESLFSDEVSKSFDILRLRVTVQESDDLEVWTDVPGLFAPVTRSAPKKFYRGVVTTEGSGN